MATCRSRFPPASTVIVSNPQGSCSSFLLTSASLPPGRHMTSVSTSLSRLTFRTKLLPISSELGWPGWRNVLHVRVATCSFSVTTSLRRAIALSSVLMRSSRRSFSLDASCSPMTRTAETSPSIVPMRVFTRVPFWRHSGHGHTPPRRASASNATQTAMRLCSGYGAGSGQAPVLYRVDVALRLR